MTISDFSIHNVLRTYNKQFRIGKLVKGKGTSQSEAKSDAVEISMESRQMAFIKSLSNEVAVRVGDKATPEQVEVKVAQNIESVVGELSHEISPEDENFVELLKEKLVELF